jgi:hypothetical protein
MSEPCPRGGLNFKGSRIRDTHFKFSLELVGATILRNVSFRDAEKEWQRIMPTILDVGFNALRSIDTIFVVYARIRNLSI